jgi:quercetin dioxygenase-like cupin family protein
MVEVKKIRDFVGNVRIADQDHPDAVPVSCETMWDRTKGRPLQVQLYSLAPGATVNDQHHDEGMSLVLCWSGGGKATVTPRKVDDTGWGAALPEVNLVPGDTMAVPRAAKIRFAANSTVQPDNKDPGDLQPVDKFVFLLLQSDMPQSVDPPALPTVTDASSLIRKISRYSYFNRNAEERCVRSRIWGREAQGKLDGGPDIAKPYFHLTAYCFVPQQENPQHFHPHSLEFVLCVQGRANMTVRHLVDDDDFGRGWEDQFEVREIEPGDVIIVPIAAQHRYITSGSEDLVLLASQTPHPIMHILEQEVVAP